MLSSLLNIAAHVIGDPIIALGQALRLTGSGVVYLGEGMESTGASIELTGENVKAQIQDVAAEEELREDFNEFLAKAQRLQEAQAARC